MRRSIPIPTAVLISCVPLLAQGRAPDLDAPVRVESGGEFIDVTIGHAAPCMFDLDGDGVRDLIVGEYGDQPFSAERLPKDTKLSDFEESRLRVYRNLGTDSAPRFDGFEYLKAGDQHASIPST